MPEKTRISLALARFDAALQALETCARQAQSAERGAAEAELRELRGQTADLARNNREAGRRIDTAIAKIRAALGN
jgi:hypothetical protein